MNNLNQFDFFSGEVLKETLKKNYRIYLCGNLSVPQEALDCIYDDKLEIGTSFYEFYTADVPHYHKNATEYNFVVYGTVKLYLFDTKETFEFTEGSLYVLPPNTKYATKNAPNTQVLFMKCPGGNDKMLYDCDEHLRKWLISWDA